MIITQERAVEIARAIVNTRIKIQVHGDLAMIDNNLMGGIELAHMVTSGYVSQLTLSGERRLMETHNRITALWESLQSKPALPAAPAQVAYLHQRLTRADGTRVLVGDTIIDETGDPFTVVGAEWNDMIDERTPVLVGYWQSIGQGADDAGGAHVSTFPDVQWKYAYDLATDVAAEQAEYARADAKTPVNPIHL